MLNLSPKVPASPSFTDSAAAWREDGFLNRWHLDPISRRGYPMDIIQYYGHSLDVIQTDDLQVIATPLNFLGVN